MKFAIGQKVVKKQTREVCTIKEVRFVKEGVFYFVEESDSCFSESCFEEIKDISIEDLYTGDLVMCKDGIVWKVLKGTAWGDMYVAPTTMGISTRLELDIVRVIRPLNRFELLDDFPKELNKNCR